MEENVVVNDKAAGKVSINVSVDVRDGLLKMKKNGKFKSIEAVLRDVIKTL